MAIQIQGNGGVVAEVDGTTFRALRVTARPVNYGSLGSYAMGMVSGTIAAALAANSELYQFRWSDASNLCLVYNVDVSACLNVAASAAALLSLRLCIARSWTVAGSGGTRATLTGNNCKLRTSMGTSLVNDAGMATTAALTAGTKTLDTMDIGLISYGWLTGAITTTPSGLLVPLSNLFDTGATGAMPIVFAQNEGFVVRSGIINPAGGTWALGVNTFWTEAASF